jgi:hypothetical protein
MIDAKCLIVQWQSKGHNARTIHAKLATRLHEKGPIYSPVTNCLRHLHSGEDIFEPGIHSAKPLDSLVGFKILMELAGFPFHGARTLASTLRITKSAIWDHR